MKERKKRKKSALTQGAKIFALPFGVTNYFGKPFEDSALSWLHNLVPEAFLEACSAPVPDDLEMKDPLSLLEELTV